VDGNNFQISTSRGCPQGEVLSPLMWSLVVDKLLGILTGNGVTCLGYADDIVIMAKLKFEGTLCDIVERQLETTRRWCLSVGLRINHQKPQWYLSPGEQDFSTWEISASTTKTLLVSRTYPRLKTYLEPPRRKDCQQGKVIIDGVQEHCGKDVG